MKQYVLFGCPKDTEIRNFGTMSTLVGWFGGEDPNHHTTSCECTGCGKQFNKEFVYRGRKVWYMASRDRHILQANLDVVNPII